MMELWKIGTMGLMARYRFYIKRSLPFLTHYSSIPKFQSIPYGYKPVEVHEFFKQRLFRVAWFHLTWAGVQYI